MSSGRMQCYHGSIKEDFSGQKGVEWIWVDRIGFESGEGWKFPRIFKTLNVHFMLS